MFRPSCQEDFRIVKPLIILGTGVHAVEMAEMVDRINARRSTWELLGFASCPGAGNSTDADSAGYPVFDEHDVTGRFPDAFLVPANTFRSAFPVPPARLTTLVDPSTIVSSSARIGVGCVLYPHCFVGLNARLGNRVFVLAGTVINHDDRIEDDVVVCSGVTLAGFVHVESGCYLGQRSSVRQHVRIGRNSFLGMGTVVLQDVEPNSVMVGNPARKLRDRAAQT